MGQKSTHLEILPLFFNLSLRHSVELVLDTYPNIFPNCFYFVKKIDKLFYYYIRKRIHMYRVDSERERILQ